VEERAEVVPDELPHRRVRTDLRPRRQLGLADLGERVGAGELAGHPDPLHQRLDVGAVGQVGGVDGGLVPGVGAAQPDAAAAAHVHQRDQQGERPYLRVGQAFPLIGRGKRVPLQIRGGK